MKRYRTSPRAAVDMYGDQFTAPTIVVHEEAGHAPTGILNARGQMIFTCWETEPVGFVPTKERT